MRSSVRYLADWLGNAGSRRRASTPIRADSAGVRRMGARTGTDDEIDLAALSDYTGWPPAWCVVDVDSVCSLRILSSSSSSWPTDPGAALIEDALLTGVPVSTSAGRESLNRDDLRTMSIRFHTLRLICT
jgi:hypothetical protein